MTCELQSGCCKATRFKNFRVFFASSFDGERLDFMKSLATTEYATIWLF